MIQERIAKVRAERESAVAHRTDALTGTSDYPLLSEAKVAVLDAIPVPIPPPVAAIRYPPLAPVRLAAPFEALRAAADAELVRSGERPKIFLANLGTLAEFTVRAAFAKNFFEAGGIEAVTSDGFAGRDEMIAAFQSSGAKLVCLCSSDAVYDREVAQAARALAAAGAAHIYLAGRPKAQDALKAAGVADFIYAGCNVLATLQAAHGILALKG
jgi:methylmalonyl-CoA mutase